MNTTKQNILKLEKRGCDFWVNSQERELSDLTNFRLCGEIESPLYDSKHERKGNYFIEVCTNIQNNKFRKGIYTFFRNCYDSTDGMCYGDLEKDGQTQDATKKGVLEYINRVFGCNYTDIEIVDRL